MANSKNYIVEFGEPQLPQKITNKKKERGHPLKELNSDAQANNWVEDAHDPHHYVRRFPCGSQLIHSWGKNPRTTFYHTSGTSINIYPDGSMHILTAGNHNEYHKGGQSVTVEGHQDQRGGGHVRNNYEGGLYEDVAGDHATHVAGNTAHHTVGNHTMNVSGNLNIKGNKQLTIGTQDDNGNMMMTINMNNGRIQFAAKGDMEFTSKTGAIKFKGQNVSIMGQDTVAINAGNQISKSAPIIATAAEKIFKVDKPPIVATTKQTEQGIHDSVASSKTAYNYTNTIKSKG